MIPPIGFGSKNGKGTGFGRIVKVYDTLRVQPK
ncbi:hypothetical protein J2Z37_000175 [Ammoniphilus resinae]|uniref:Uncharacterized protein n=1 Tax=Ammoniphilus resinae TaxID=861532 RepID=A0ABS4GIV8_9BACL|nr:hypothetical protein [Ammoniphilus resinae]